MFNPAQKILRGSEVESFINQNNFAEAAKYLFHSQLNSWDLLRKNYDAMKFIQVKSFWYDGFKINVQVNTAVKIFLKIRKEFYFGKSLFCSVILILYFLSILLLAH